MYFLKKVLKILQVLNILNFQKVLENPAYEIVSPEEFKEPNPPMCSKTGFQPVDEPVEIKSENAESGVKSENFTPEPFNPALTPFF